MAEQSSEYKSIVKGTSLFGGVQVYSILISVIKAKIVALLLGPIGVGIQGLFISGTQLVRSLTSFGLVQSAVRDVSSAYSSGDEDRVSRTTTVLRRLVIITGSLGMIAVLLFSPLLSKYSFGHTGYTLSFAILSLTLLFDQLANGQNVVLQGTRKLSFLAKSQVYGATVALIVSIPLFYFFREKGIVPALIINSITVFILAKYFASRVSIKKVQLSINEVFKEGRQMLVLGVAMSLTSILSTASAFILRGFISNHGGEVEIGLFQAGFAIINTYVGMVFTAMSTDYYPRLAGVNNDNEKSRSIMNQQGEVGTLLLAPLLIICITFMPIVIRILYSEEFLLANNYVLWAVPGMMFKLASWVISLLFVAKGESKLFMANEFFSSIYVLLLNLLGYHIYGLSGLGAAFSIGFFIYFLQVFIIAKKRYGFSFTAGFHKTFYPQLILVGVCFMIAILGNPLLKYGICIPLLILSSYISLKGLENRTNLLSSIKNRMKNK